MPPRPRPEAAGAKPPARVGRPTPERAAAIDQAILAAARAQFLEGGYEGAAMEAIAAAAQVSKGTLYARYPTKSALLRAVVRLQIQAWTADHVRTAPLPDDFQQRLQQLARGILAALMAEETRPYHRLTHRAAFDEREIATALHELAFEPAIADLTDEIVRGAKDAPTPPVNPQQVARMLLSTLYGWWAEREAAGGATREEANAYADHAVAVLLHGQAAW